MPLSLRNIEEKLKFSSIFRRGFWRKKFNDWTWSMNLSGILWQILNPKWQKYLIAQSSTAHVDHLSSSFEISDFKLIEKCRLPRLLAYNQTLIYYVKIRAKIIFLLQLCFWKSNISDLSQLWTICIKEFSYN